MEQMEKVPGKNNGFYYHKNDGFAYVKDKEKNENCYIRCIKFRTNGINCKTRGNLQCKIPIIIT